jgi:tRNA A-37 threonylcarbamoyl transferase component Bud32
MNTWILHPHHTDAESALFPSLDQTFRLGGEYITASPLSRVVRVETGGKRYYIKSYHRAGKHLQAWLGPSRVETEWKNLARFADWGIPTARVVAHGQERRFGRFVRGALVTEEIPRTTDLAQLARAADPRLRDRNWVSDISHQLATLTRTLHGHRFAHNDLKWRNLLVDESGHLFLIDCPLGNTWWGPILRHRIIKDLACLDKVAKTQLSQTQRLRFYLNYLARPRLAPGDKRQLRRILRYFEGRE